MSSGGPLGGVLQVGVSSKVVSSGGGGVLQGVSSGGVSSRGGVLCGGVSSRGGVL